MEDNIRKEMMSYYNERVKIYFEKYDEYFSLSNIHTNVILV